MAVNLERYGGCCWRPAAPPAQCPGWSIPAGRGLRRRPARGDPRQPDPVAADQLRHQEGGGRTAAERLQPQGASSTAAPAPAGPWWSARASRTRPPRPSPARSSASHCRATPRSCRCQWTRRCTSCRRSRWWTRCLQRLRPADGRDGALPHHHPARPDGQRDGECWTRWSGSAAPTPGPGSFEKPDPAIAKIVAGWAHTFAAERAQALGFQADDDYDSIVRGFIEEDMVVPNRTGAPS